MSYQRIQLGLITIALLSFAKSTIKYFYPTPLLASLL